VAYSHTRCVRCPCRRIRNFKFLLLDLSIILNNFPSTTGVLRSLICTITVFCRTPLGELTTLLKPQDQLGRGRPLPTAGEGASPPPSWGGASPPPFLSPRRLRPLDLGAIGVLLLGSCTSPIQTLSNATTRDEPLTKMLATPLFSRVKLPVLKRFDAVHVCEGQSDELKIAVALKWFLDLFI